MTTPNITRAQLVALVAGVLQTLLAFGVHLSAFQQHVVLADTGLVATLLIADGVIRQARAKNAYAIASAAQLVQTRNTTQTPAAAAGTAQAPVQVAQP